MAICNCCNKKVKDGEYIICFACGCSFSTACVNLLAADTRILRSKSNLKWTCNDCSSGDSIASSLRETISKLTLKVQELSESILRMQDNPSHIGRDELFEEVVSECMEREKRSCNAIFFGIAETEDASVADQVTPIISALSSDPGSLIKAFRLGKPRSDGKPRPIKVILKTKQNALNILKNGSKLKDNNLFSNVYIRSDKTPCQQAFERKVRSELKARTDNGENDLFIKYTNNVPSISKKN